MTSLLARLGRGLRESREPILIFLATRAALFLLAYLSLAVLPLNPDPSVATPAGGPWRGFPTNLWLDGWARWDAGWYEHIAKHGYVDQAVGPAGQRNLAFYPLYPLTMRLVSLAGLGAAPGRDPDLEPRAPGRAAADPPDGARPLRRRGGIAVRVADERVSPSPSTSAPSTRRACSCCWPSPRCSSVSEGNGPARPSARSSAARRARPGSPSRRRSGSSISNASDTTCAR